MTHLMFFLFGLASLIGQVLLLREVMVLFYGTEIAIGVFFGGWLCGIGMGASAGAAQFQKFRGMGAWGEGLFSRRPFPQNSHCPRNLVGLFAHSLSLLGLSVILEILLVRHIPHVFGTGPAEIAPLHGILVVVPLTTFVPAFLTGFLFPVGCRCLHAAHDRGIAQVYAFEALGSLVAGLAFTFVLVRVFPALSIAALSALALAVGATAYGLLRGNRSCLVTGALVVFSSIAMLLPTGEGLDDWSNKARWKALHPGIELLTSRPTPYQQAEIGRLGKQLSFFGNGKIAASFPDPHVADRMAALIMAQNPDAKRVLLIGGGIGSLVRSLLRHPIERLDVVEPDPWAFRVAAQYLPPDEALGLKDPRVSLEFVDGRLFVNRLGEHRYDVIATMIPDPIAAVWNRYYTREFFTAAAKALTRGGFFLTRVTSAENYWGAEVASYAGSIYHTLKKVFPVVMGTPGDETIFFAAAAADLLSLDPVVLRARYRKPDKSVFDPVMFATILPPTRVAFAEKQLADSPAVINTDFEPVSTALAMILWGRFAGTQRLDTLNTIRGGGVAVYLIPLGLFVLGRLAFRARWGPREGREPRFQALVAMAAIGACAMGTQIVLIYGYQSLFGYVFERIGLVTAAFMTGLALGGLAMGALLPRVARKDVGLVIVLGLFAGFSLLLPVALERIGTAHMPQKSIPTNHADATDRPSSAHGSSVIIHLHGGRAELKLPVRFISCCEIPPNPPLLRGELRCALPPALPGGELCVSFSPLFSKGGQGGFWPSASERLCSSLCSGWSEVTGMVRGFGSGSGGQLFGNVGSPEKPSCEVLGEGASFKTPLPPALFHVEAVMLCLVLFSGCVTGAGFPLVASRHLELSRNPGESSGKTDAADHYGAAVGALMTGALLMPLLGMGRSCTVLAMIAMTPAVLIAAEWVFPREEPLCWRLFRPRRPSFPYVRLTWTLAFLVLGAMMWRLAAGSPGFVPTLHFDAATIEKISGSTEFVHKETPYPHYLGRSAGSGVTVNLASYPVAGEVKGFGGPMNLLVSVSDKGVIKGVRLLESRETPQYLAGMDEWLAKLHDRSILDPDLGRVDTLSGATITCKAVSEILSRTGQRIAGPILGLAVAVPAEDSSPAWREVMLDGRLAGVVSLLSLFVVAFYSRSRRLRLVCLGVSLILLGWYLNAPFTCVDAASLLDGRLPGSGALWRVVLVVGVLAISCLWGQAWCGFLCPFGALQEFLCVNRLRRHPSPPVEAAGRYTKFALLAVLLALFFLSDDTVWFSFSPLQHFFGWRMEPWVLVLSVTVLAASVWYFRFWCRYLCPAGAFLALFNRVRLLRRMSPRTVPARCDLGVDSPDHVDCIRCHRCIES
ncbi:MAG: fused MFS/spermidine synthase [Thermodesulfobacteriota bacterium]